MSTYRPWGPPAGKSSPAAHAPAAPPDGAPEADAPEPPYAPWQKKRETESTPATKGFEAPPGLADAAPTRSGARGIRLAGALLLWAGGFLIIGAMAGAAWSGGMADFMAQGSGNDPEAIQMARSLQAGSLVVGLLAGVPAAVAGVGILYRQPWSRGAGIVAACLQLLMVPVGTILGIVALALLTRQQSRWWFQ